jgi:phosphoglycolate phosphatase
MDFDGVLADTAQLTYSLRKKIDPSLTFRDFLDLFEANIYESEPEIIPDQATLDDLDRAYETGLSTIAIDPLVLKAIASLSDKYLIAIVSSSSDRVISAYLARQGLAAIIVTILGRDAGLSKSLKIGNYLLGKGLPPEDAVLVTDTLGDMREAGICGVKSIAVEWGYHDGRTIMLGNPITLAKTPGELEIAVRRALG